MKDNELRSLVLQKYYDLRERDFFQWGEIPRDQIPEVKDFNELGRISEQLSEHGLIEWKPLRTLGRYVGGMGKITAYGVDVVEGVEKSPISINLDNSHSVNVSNSSNVQVGNHNSISNLIKIKELQSAIDDSDFTPQQKAEAKTLLSKFLEHPVTAAIIGGLASTIK